MSIQSVGRHCISKFPTVCVQIVEYICFNYMMVLTKLLNIIVWIAKYIGPNCYIYLFGLINVFFEIATYICPNYWRYLSDLQNGGRLLVARTVLSEVFGGTWNTNCSSFLSHWYLSKLYMFKMSQCICPNY